MITLNLEDPHLVENFKAIRNIRASGLFSDEEIQRMYEYQQIRDKAEAALAQKGGDG